MTEEKRSLNKSIKNNIGWLIFILIFLTLPFHYVPSEMKMFPKDHLTLDHTIITQKDVDNIIEQFNNSNVLEQSAMNNDPFIRTLREHGIIVKKDKTDSSEDK